MADVSLTALPIIGIPIGAGAIAFATFSYLSQSAPLKQTALDWLTKPNPTATIHLQYLLMRRALFGTTPFSIKRNIAFAAIFFFLFLVLAGAELHMLYAERDSESPAVILLHFYAIMYFQMWRAAVGSAVVLLLVGFLICHASFYIFDSITLRWLKFRDSFAKYLALLVVGYASCFVMLCFLGVVTAVIVLEPAAADMAFPWSFAARVSRALHQIYLLFWPDQELLDPEFDLRPLFATGLFGTMLLCFASIFFVTALNLVYAAALGVLRVDLWYRKIYGYDQTKLLESPIEYVARLAAFIVFVVVLGGELIGLAASKFM